jgi:hypothetical protein
MIIKKTRNQMASPEIHRGRDHTTPFEGKWADDAVPTAGGCRSVFRDNRFLQLGFLERQNIRNQALRVRVFWLGVNGTSISYFHQLPIKQNAESMTDVLDDVNIMGYE